MKNVITNRNYGDILVRTNSIYEETGIKDKNKISLFMPDGEAELLNRVGGINKIVKNDSASDIFTGFAVAVVAADEVQEAEAKVNQGLVTVERELENEYKLKADFGKLESFAHHKYGEGKWIELLLTLDATTIEGISYNGRKLDAEDIADAVAAGGKDGDLLITVNMEDKKTIFTLTNEKGSSVIELIPTNTAA